MSLHVTFKKGSNRQQDLTGKRFGMLTAICILEQGTGDGPTWLFLCDCGKTVASLKRRIGEGRKTNCGCTRKPRATPPKKAPPEVGSEEWKRDRLCSVYKGMRKRCYYQNDTSWPHYGARGITICDTWLNDKTSFIEWSLAHGYEEGLQIDRRDNNAGYSPDNCRWVTVQTNSQNRRTTVITYEVAQEIKGMLAEGHKPRAIADTMNVRPHIVYNIKNNDAWGKQPRNYYRDNGTSWSRAKKGDAE